VHQGVVAERLAEADPTNTERQRDLSISHNRLGDLTRAAGLPNLAVRVTLHVYARIFSLASPDWKPRFLGRASANPLMAAPVHKE